MQQESTVFERIIELLEAKQVEFDSLEHEPVFTSEEAARVRGTTLASGAKSLVCKVGKEFVMFVLPADRRLSTPNVKQAFSVRKLRFATRDEVLEFTGLEPGSIPPFGSLFELPCYCDERLAAEQRINFNAGDHGKSVSMTFADYLTVEQPTVGIFAE